MHLRSSRRGIDPGIPWLASAPSPSQWSTRGRRPRLCVCSTRRLVDGLFVFFEAMPRPGHPVGSQYAVARSTTGVRLAAPSVGFLDGNAPPQRSARGPRSVSSIPASRGEPARRGEVDGRREGGAALSARPPDDASARALVAYAARPWR